MSRPGGPSSRCHHPRRSHGQPCTQTTSRACSHTANTPISSTLRRRRRHSDTQTTRRRRRRSPTLPRRHTTRPHPRRLRSPRRRRNRSSRSCGGTKHVCNAVVGNSAATPSVRIAARARARTIMPYGPTARSTRDSSASMMMSTFCRHGRGAPVRVRAQVRGPTG